MTIRARALADDPMDLSVGLLIQDSGEYNSFPFGDDSYPGGGTWEWTPTRAAAGDMRTFQVVKITGDSAKIRKIDGGALVFDDIAIDDFVAFDSFVVWHIPAADLDPDFVPEGGSYSELNVNPIM